MTQAYNWVIELLALANLRKFDSFQRNLNHFQAESVLNPIRNILVGLGGTEASFGIHLRYGRANSHYAAPKTTLRTWSKWLSYEDKGSTSTDNSMFDFRQNDDD